MNTKTTEERGAPGWSLITAYEVNPYFSAEVAHLVNTGGPLSVGVISPSETVITTTGDLFWSLSAMGSWPFNETFSIFIRVGEQSFGGSSVTTQGGSVTSEKISSNELY